LNVSVSKNGKDWQDVYTLEDEKKAGENDIKLPSSMRTFLKRKDDPNKENFAYTNIALYNCFWPVSNFLKKHSANYKKE